MQWCFKQIKLFSLTSFNKSIFSNSTFRKWTINIYLFWFDVKISTFWYLPFVKIPKIFKILNIWRLYSYINTTSKTPYILKNLSNEFYWQNY